jgi:hypothetical protein
VGRRRYAGLDGHRSWRSPSQNPVSTHASDSRRRYPVDRDRVVVKPGNSQIGGDRRRRDIDRFDR